MKTGVLFTKAYINSLITFFFQINLLFVLKAACVYLLFFLFIESALSEFIISKIHSTLGKHNTYVSQTNVMYYHQTFLNEIWQQNTQNTHEAKLYKIVERKIEKLGNLVKQK